MKALIKQVGNSQKKEWSGLWQIILIVVGVVVIVGLIASFRYDPELAKFVAYLIGGGLLLWQVWASSQRAKAAEETAKAMQKTANSTEKGNIAERFKNAIEHLGHESTSVRMGGIYALHHIAQDEKEYRERILEILCGHIRDTTTQDGYKPRMIQIDGKNAGMLVQPSIEIQSILKLLFVDPTGCDIYTKLNANLEYANLEGVILMNANLQNTSLRYANLRDSKLVKTNLQGADLSFSKLKNSQLRNTKLQGAILENAILQNAKHFTAEDLLDTKTLYKAILPDEIEAEIRQLKPELLEEPKPDNETDT